MDPGFRRDDVIWSEGARIVNLSTNTGGFAADLLQVQPSATIGSIDDCRFEDTDRTASDDAGRA
jgi:hypothetical protein